MKNYPEIKSKREFVRARRRDLKRLKKASWDIRSGCAITDIYGEQTQAMYSAVDDISVAINCIDEITKRLAK